MAKSKTLAGQALRSLRSGLAQLKKAGLYKGNVRAAKGGWRQKSLLKTFADLLTGKAKAVKVGSKQAKAYSESHRVRNGVVVVAARKDEKLRFDKKTGNITSKREEYGVKYRRIVVRKKINTPADIPDNPPKGKKWLYKLPHNPLRDRFHVVELLNQYKGKKGFMEALEIYELSAADFPDDEDADDIDEARLEEQAPKRTRSGGKRSAARSRRK